MMSSVQQVCSMCVLYNEQHDEQHVCATIKCIASLQPMHSPHNNPQGCCAQKYTLTCWYRGILSKAQISGAKSESRLAIHP